MMGIKSLYNGQYERRALYSDFLEELINNVKNSVKLSKAFFNPLKFKEQFFQSVYIFEDYLNYYFFSNQDKIVLADLFAGIGTYALFFANYYSSFIKKIYATEIDKTSYKIMERLISVYTHKNLIIPCKVEEMAGYNPYLCKNINNVKFSAIIANPPYVPIPPEKKYSLLCNGGTLGISGIIELLKDLNKHTSKNSLLGCLSYSIGKAKIEKGSIITATLNDYEMPIGKDYKIYRKLINKLSKQWSLKFFILNPPAWVGFNQNKKEMVISLEEYYDLIFPKKDKKISNFIKKFNEDCRFLHNVFIIGIRKENIQTPWFVLKNIDSSYIDDVMELERKCWPENLQATRQNLYSRLTYYPEGCVGAFDVNGNLIGFATSQRVNFYPYNEIKIRDLEKWMELDNFPDSDIRETSSPNGNALHLVSACVLEEYRGKGIWKDMIIYRLRLAKFLGLEYVVITSRLNYPKKDVKFDELINYIESYRDPYLKVLRKFGFTFNGLIKKPEDIDSAGYWVILYKKL
jgi:GNAT superfamily N-acetyltransferase/16S rRNA G966 N2-methylase RsmD